MQLIRTLALGLLGSGAAAVAVPVDPGFVSGPIGGCVPTDTIVVGDGDPHQDVLHQQITDNIACGDGTCGMGASQSYSVSVGFSIGPGAGGSVQSPAQWIAGSFNVAESWSQSQTESCNGEEGEVICVWHAMHHTAYTVVDSADAQNPCTAPNDGEYVIRSPNKDDPLSGFYCVRGQTNCHVLGSQYWENGPAGGY